MGITLFDADMIVQEHCYKPLPPTVHLMGRQTIHFDMEAARRLLERYGIQAADVPIEVDKSTRDAQARAEQFISDTTFFGMLGTKKIVAIDHSDYEGAEVIVDLNYPLPVELEGIADFIFGGSVLDNVFDPANYIRNMTRLLRPGGRVIDTNACSFSRHAYALASPAWYLDYCVTNNFADCSVYISEGGPHLCNEPSHMYALDVDPEQDLIPNLGDPLAGFTTGVTLIAEKGHNTTWQYNPSQDGYRNAGEWKPYRERLTKMKSQKRPLMRYAPPNPVQLAAYPIRRARGLVYIGCFKPELQETLRPTQVPELLDQELPRGIRIIEATYGWSQRNAKMNRTGLVPIYRGNVTGIMAFLLNGRDGCDMVIDVSVLGDPAPGLAKDLLVVYYDAGEAQPRVQQVYIPEEAHGKRLVLATKNNCGEKRGAA